MSHNTFGHLFRVTTWGESHGPAIGCVVDGCPPLIPLSEADIQPFRARPSAAFESFDSVSGKAMRANSPFEPSRAIRNSPFAKFGHMSRIGQQAFVAAH